MNSWRYISKSAHVHQEVFLQIKLRKCQEKLHKPQSQPQAQVFETEFALTLSDKNVF